MVRESYFSSHLIRGHDTAIDIATIDLHLFFLVAGIDCVVLYFVSVWSEIWTESIAQLTAYLFETWLDDVDIELFETAF